MKRIPIAIISALVLSSVATAQLKTPEPGKRMEKSTTHPAAQVEPRTAPESVTPSPSASSSQLSTAQQQNAPALPSLPGDPGAGSGEAVPLDSGLLMALLAGGGIAANLLRKKKKVKPE